MNSQSQRRHIIYLHGFRSSPHANKARLLQAVLANDSSLELHIPDLNQPPVKVWQVLCQLVEQSSQVGLIGSSLGGFYATQLVAKYGCPAVLINPVVRPWQRFHELFADQLPLVIHQDWQLTQADLDDLYHLVMDKFPLDKILLLLQQGDEILDYREAQRYYTEQHRAFTIIEMGGNHAMDNFAEKIPMLLQFLADSIV